MSRRWVPAIILGASFGAIVGPADGQPPLGNRPPLDQVFKRADANADGSLTRAEFDRFIATLPRLKDNADAAFKRLDADSDGKLTLEEFKRLSAFAGRPAPADPNRKNPFTDPNSKAPKPAEPKVAIEKDAPATPEQVAFFEKKIRPVLIAQCYSCHSEETKKGAKGGLLVDTRAGLRKGGDNGPSLVPGNPAKSLLIKALKGTDDTAQMPPKEKLSADVIADFERWIAMGAPDPRTGASTTQRVEIDIEKGRQHWAFQPPKAATPPTVKNAAWPRSDVDRFVLAKLENKNLNPVGDADKATLLRRVHFDLVGLPPTPQELEAFLNDKSPNAFENVVDKLLASSAFGEKWGRHWLDVARYAESSGKEQNMLYPFAWRYRDYVVQAFNTDKPIDQFFREQLAGDRLPAKSDNEKAEHLIATGYLAVGPKSHNERNGKQFQLDLADEQIDAFSQGMLGLTVACARCHDHKFDPIPTKDYYALAGIFTSTNTLFGTAAGIQSRQAAPLAELPKDANFSVGAKLSTREIERLRERLEDLKKDRDKLREEMRQQDRATATPPVRLLFVTQQIAVTEKQLDYYDKDGTAKKMAMAVADKNFPRDIPVHIRGELDKTGDIAPRGFVQVISTGPMAKITDGSGRKELAEWVVSPTNPLTARVFVNRVWLNLFGRGLVATPDNFGTTGQKPSHPELLDFLAVRFTRDGWSTKRLIRSLVLTRTYQMASAYSATNAETDPDNIDLWRMSKRRLSAEAIRDSMLAISGELDSTPPNGSPVQRYEGNVAVIGRFGGGANLAESSRRSVYLPVIRDQVPESLELFDFAEPSLVTGSRDDTSVPSQGLYLLNNPGVMKLADQTATRLLKDYLSPTERINAGFRLAFGRTPTQTEVDASERFLQQFTEAEAKGSRRKADVDKASWAAFAQALFAAAEFRYVD